MKEILNIYREKMKNNKLLLLILITGILFMLMPSCESEERDSPEGDNYEAALEERTEKLLAEIDGAGRVKVMMTYEDKGRTYPVTDVTGNGENMQEKTVSVSGKVAVQKEDYPKVRGVAVVCEGADNERVREDILQAVEALTGAPIHCIKVLRMKR